MNGHVRWYLIFFLGYVQYFSNLWHQTKWSAFLYADNDEEHWGIAFTMGNLISVVIVKYVGLSFYQMVRIRYVSPEHHFNAVFLPRVYILFLHFTINVVETKPTTKNCTSNIYIYFFISCLRTAPVVSLRW